VCAGLLLPRTLHISCKCPVDNSTLWLSNDATCVHRDEMVAAPPQPQIQNLRRLVCGPECDDDEAVFAERVFRLAKGLRDAKPAPKAK
jgi:hypothetical protein